MTMMQTLLAMAAKLGPLCYMVTPYDAHDPREPVRPFILEALPVLIAMCIGEFVFCSMFLGKRDCFRPADMLSSVALGLLQAAAGAVFKMLWAPVYAWIYSTWSVIQWGVADDGVWGRWVASVLLTDFLFYALHRCAHEYQGFWATHAVHHSGEFFNLALSFRQGALQPLFAGALHVVPALLGMPPAVSLAHQQLNSLFQFWTHTEAVGRLPFPFEYIFNSPSHHRLHHEYPGNCNYGGVFIIWDRAFGTFRAETDEELVRGFKNYGLAAQVHTFDPVEINLMGLRKVWQVGFWKRRVRHALFAQTSFRELFTPMERRVVTDVVQQNGLAACKSTKKRPAYLGFEGSFSRKDVSDCFTSRRAVLMEIVCAPLPVGITSSPAARNSCAALLIMLALSLYVSLERHLKPPPSGVETFSFGLRLLTAVTAFVITLVLLAFVGALLDSGRRGRMLFAE